MLIKEKFIIFLMFQKDRVCFTIKKKEISYIRTEMLNNFF